MKNKLFLVSPSSKLSTECMDIIKGYESRFEEVFLKYFNAELDELRSKIGIKESIDAKIFQKNDINNEFIVETLVFWKNIIKEEVLNDLNNDLKIKFDQYKKEFKPLLIDNFFSEEVYISRITKIAKRIDLIVKIFNLKAISVTFLAIIAVIPAVSLPLSIPLGAALAWHLLSFITGSVPKYTETYDGFAYKIQKWNEENGKKIYSNLSKIWIIKIEQIVKLQITNKSIPKDKKDLFFDKVLKVIDILIEFKELPIKVVKKFRKK